MNYSLLSHKVERALAAFVGDHTPASLSGVAVLTSNESGTREAPYVVLEATEGTERVVNHGIYDVPVEVRVVTNAHDVTPAAHEGRCGDLFSELADFATLKSELNLPAGEDTRTVQDVHFFNVRFADIRQELDAEGHQREGVLVLECVCMGRDGS